MIIDPSPGLAGGKGAHLYRLRDLLSTLEGLQVPPFFVLSISQQELEDSETQSQIMARARGLDAETLAVRSSANCEDAEAHAFPGVFESHLNVRLEDVLDAVSSVLESASAARVSEYCKASGVDYASIKMAVVVQKMIDSALSGVCFSRHVLGSNYSIVEACLGQGEGLVSGRIEPDSLLIDRSSGEIAERRIANQRTFASFSDEGSGLQYLPVPFFRATAQKASDETVLRIAACAVDLEERLGYSAVDLEWAADGRGNLYVLQVRPYALRPDGGDASAVPRTRE